MYKQKNFVTPNGIRVDSVGELNIAQILENLGIPYEHGILLVSDLIDGEQHPDFTIYPDSEDFCLIEYRGMLALPPEDPKRIEYVRTCKLKDIWYEKAGLADRLLNIDGMPNYMDLSRIEKDIKDLIGYKKTIVDPDYVDIYKPWLEESECDQVFDDEKSEYEEVFTEEMSLQDILESLGSGGRYKYRYKYTKMEDYPCPVWKCELCGHINKQDNKTCAACSRRGRWGDSSTRVITMSGENILVGENGWYKEQDRGKGLISSEGASGLGKILWAITDSIRWLRGAR